MIFSEISSGSLLSSQLPHQLPNSMKSSGYFGGSALCSKLLKRLFVYSAYVFTFFYMMANRLSSWRGFLLLGGVFWVFTILEPGTSRESEVGNLPYDLLLFKDSSSPNRESNYKNFWSQRFFMFESLFLGKNGVFQFFTDLFAASSWRSRCSQFGKQQVEVFLIIVSSNFLVRELVNYEDEQKLMFKSVSIGEVSFFIFNFFHSKLRRKT